MLRNSLQVCLSLKCYPGSDTVASLRRCYHAPSVIVSLCRAKAGGRQSTQDNTGKFAKSAGSQIRRYNEVRAVAAMQLQAGCRARPLR